MKYLSKLFCVSILLLSVLLLGCKGREVAKSDQLNDTQNEQAEARNDGQLISENSTMLNSDSVASIVEDFCDQLIGYSANDARIMQENESTVVYSIPHGVSMIEDYLLIIDKKELSIIKAVDLRSFNPYLGLFGEEDNVPNHQQMVGRNIEVKGPKSNLPIDLPGEIYGAIDAEFYISYLHMSQYVFSECSNCPVVVCYGMSFLPEDEILEYVSYPGYSSIVVFDPLSGNQIFNKDYLPFVTSDCLVDVGEEYLLITHQRPVEEEGYFDSIDDWKHYVSIYSLESGQVCYRDSSTDDYYIGVDENSAHPYFHKYLDEPEIDADFRRLEEGVIVDGVVFKTEIDYYNFIRTESGLQIRYQDGRVVELRYRSDFDEINLDCE